MRNFIYILFVFAALWQGCETQKAADQADTINPLEPDFITDSTLVDTDDPAIWLHPTDPLQSLILGTDKGEDNGGIYTFDLKGKLQPEQTLTGLPRPNNIDLEYGFVLGTDTMDIAVFTQRNGDNVRIIRVPEMTYVDGEGIDVFEDDELKAPMGISLYKKPSTGQIYMIVSRKSGPTENYLYQYLLKDSSGIATAQLVRRFGVFTGGKEIEAIAVDDELGYIYYSDEGAGVRKYYADPDSSNTELAFFAQDGFTDDHEGISIYTKPNGEGYILVSDQQANLFHVFTREGTPENPHDHQLVAIIPTSTLSSDGSEVSSASFGDLYPSGFFVAMSDDRTFQIYNWNKFEEAIKKAQLEQEQQK